MRAFGALIYECLSRTPPPLAVLASRPTNGPGPPPMAAGLVFGRGGGGGGGGGGEEELGGALLASQAKLMPAGCSEDAAELIRDCLWKADGDQAIFLSISLSFCPSLSVSLAVSLFSTSTSLSVLNHKPPNAFPSPRVSRSLFLYLSLPFPLSLPLPLFLSLLILLLLLVSAYSPPSLLSPTLISGH